MNSRRVIEVCADWIGMQGPTTMGTITATPVRGKEVFSFEYDEAWLSAGHGSQLDPALGLFKGPQYPAAQRSQFGVFLDSCPDRWGRVLMRRREAQLARTEGRTEHRLLESDYLLGVHDGHRMGALRFRFEGAFQHDDTEFAAPPWTSLRELEHACLQLERDDAVNDPEYSRWLRMLIAPGGSLGGARPKASVLDEAGAQWIAKFPSIRDPEDVGAWEGVVHTLAGSAGVTVPRAQVRRFGSTHHTFLSQRFDRAANGGRRHFASAMTLLERRDGDAAEEGVSYLELADLLIRLGADTGADLEQLWRRMAFSICVSNTDDHLRNHGFLLTPSGWRLAPAYDMNPDPYGEGLKLNISESDNAQDFDLLRDVAPYFRLNKIRVSQVLDEVVVAVRKWRDVAVERGLSSACQDRMRRAFRLVI